MRLITLRKVAKMMAGDLRKLREYVAPVVGMTALFCLPVTLLAVLAWLGVVGSDWGTTSAAAIATLLWMWLLSAYFRVKEEGR